MHRRRVLELFGASAISLPGCLGSGQPRPDSSETPTPGATDSPAATTESPRSTEPPPRRLSVGETATFPDGTSLAVGTPTVQQSIIVDAGVFLSVGREKGHQYVVVDVDGSAEFAPSDFAVRRDGQLEDPPKQRQNVESVTRTCSGTCIGLPIVTKPSVESAVVYRPDDRVRAAWDLQAATVELFGVQPRCELRDARLIDHEGEVAVQFTVENVGPREAGFRALVAPAWLHDASDPVGFWVPEGETVTETFAPPELDGLAPAEATFIHEIDEDTRYFEVGSK